MRINLPNLVYSLAHPLRAARYVVYRDRIPYNAIATYLPANPVIVEAGAHDGSTTVEMASFWPQSTIHAFEPVSAAAIEVRRKVAEFGTRVQCHQLALGDADSFMDMYVSGDGSAGSCQSSSLLAPTDAQKCEFPAIPFGAKEKVRVISLDSWAAESGQDSVDFMWLDMQGYELVALAGARKVLPQVSAIHMEVSNVQLYEGASLYPAVRRAMADWGFEPVIEAFFRVSGNVLFARRSLHR
jgi:FkbM family methyltransferase